MTSFRALGYARVSTSDQAESGLGLRAQEAAITAECERRGWTLVGIDADGGASGKSLRGRPALTRAIERLENHEADALIVSRLDRLSRSVADFANIVERSQAKGWAIVLLDVNVDTTTPSGELLAGVMVQFAQYERRLAGQRTKDALAVKRFQGVRLGRPNSVGEDVRRRILAELANGSNYTRIAKHLTSDGVQTGHGASQWYASTVRKVALRAEVSPPPTQIESGYSSSEPMSSR